MPIKHQSHCYRNIKLKDGTIIKMENYADLIMSPEENLAVEAEARNEYTHIRKIKHPDGYYQLFVSQSKESKK